MGLDLGRGVPPVIKTPSSMLREKACSVRFALDRNSHRPSATAHLTCRIPGLPCRPEAPLERPEVDAAAARHGRPQGGQGAVRVLPFDPVGAFDDDVDRHAPVGGSSRASQMRGML